MQRVLEKLRSAAAERMSMRLVSADLTVFLLMASLLLCTQGQPDGADRQRSLLRTQKTGDNTIKISRLQYYSSVSEKNSPIPPNLPTRMLPPGTEKPSTAQATLSERERRFHGIIVKAANRYDVDPALVKAVIKVESGYNPKAVSQKGAAGLMQLMPGTAQELGVKDSFDPEHNVNGGVKYLKRLMNQFEGDVHLALAAYNAGSQKVIEHQGVPPIKATRHFVSRVFQYYIHYKHQALQKIGSA